MEDRLQHQPTAHEPQRAHTNRVCNPPQQGPNTEQTLPINEGKQGSRSLLIADRDIQAIKIDALTHPDEWTRKLHARVILLTIYEWDADKVSGRSLKQALDTMLVSQELKAEMVEVLRRLRLIQRKVTKNFTFVRNATIGHRDPDALAQYRAIRDLKIDEVMAVAVEFFAAVEQFVRTLTQIMSSANSLESYLRQWVESEGSQT